MQETPAPHQGREDPQEEGKAPTPWLPVRAAGTEPPATAPWSPCSLRPPPRLSLLLRSGSSGVLPTACGCVAPAQLRVSGRLAGFGAVF